MQADGKILVGGDFTNLCGQAVNRIGRLNADGSLDAAFNPGANYRADSVVVQTDGKVLVGGIFTTLNSQARNHIGRLNGDGSLDTTFNPGASDEVNSLAVQADGKILVGGWFTTLGTKPRSHIGRLNNTDAATQSLTFDGATITWLRGGASPEVGRTTFDVCTNGIDWISLGAGLHMAGSLASGWQIGGLNFPTNAAIRARGFANGGLYGGSSWFVETSINAPLPVQQPPFFSTPMFTNGYFQATLHGTPMSNYVVYVWSNLLNWTTLTTVTTTSGTTNVIDANGGLKLRFYRAKTQ